LEKKAIQGFEDFNVSPELLKAVRAMGFEEPTPIQKMSIPEALEGRDIIGQAQTGTGKTASFGIPIVEKDFTGRKPYALVIEPTRELALQVTEELGSLAAYKKCSVLTVYGGASMERQIQALRKGTNIVVGTPGRIIDHLTRGTLSTKNVSIVVLDEADEMLDMGFIADVERILEMTPETRQTMLYSATMPQEILKISKRHMKDPLKIAINVKDIITPQIKQVFYEVREKDKAEVLTRLLDVEAPERSLIFCHTKREVDEIAARLQHLGYNAGALHGDFTQSHREDMMKKFRSGRIDLLVATDVAGRGIDVENISHVINYSIPQNPEGYIHRIGRTGRAGRAGIAVTFVTPRESRQLQLIERIAKTKLSRGIIPTPADVKKARQRVIKENVSKMIGEGKHKTYLGVVRELADSVAVEEVAAAALFIAFGNREAGELEQFRPEQKEKGMTRLFMTLGRKDKIQTAEILKAIASETGISGRQIGKIDIMETFTFFEVPSDIVEKVLTAMNKAVIRGRKVAVEKAKPSNVLSRSGAGKSRFSKKRTDSRGPAFKIMAGNKGRPARKKDADDGITHKG
jgi:ATP-dependent RNA helicase DeaD